MNISGTKIENVLIKHYSWSYVGYNSNEIKCKCGWSTWWENDYSSETARKVFAKHQTDEILKALEK